MRIHIWYKCVNLVSYEASLAGLIINLVHLRQLDPPKIALWRKYSAKGANIRSGYCGPKVTMSTNPRGADFSQIISFNQLCSCL